jgi:hypothetical protein
MLELIVATPVTEKPSAEGGEDLIPFEQWRFQRCMDARTREPALSACDACDRLTTTPRYRRCSTCTHRFGEDAVDACARATCEACGRSENTLVRPYELGGSRAMLCHDCAVLAAVLSPSTVNGIRVVVEGGGMRQQSDPATSRRRRKAERRSLRRAANDRRRAREAWKQGRTLQSVRVYF